MTLLLRKESCVFDTFTNRGFRGSKKLKVVLNILGQQMLFLSAFHSSSSLKQGPHCVARLALNSGSSCLTLLSTEISGVCNYTWLLHAFKGGHEVEL
jgi:hypothetical protein